MISTDLYSPESERAPMVDVEFHEVQKKILRRINTGPLQADPDFMSLVYGFVSDHEGPVYLYGFDNFSNLGDQALWISLVRAISSLPHLDFRGLLSGPPFDQPDRYRDALIVFPAGGSLGNRYGSSLRRVELVESMRPKAILQMPVSTTFADPGLMTEARLSRAYAAPQRSLVLVRDVRSLREAQMRLSLEPHLAPDLSAVLPDMSDIHVGGRGTLFLLRKDQEAKHGHDAASGGVIADWDDIEAPLDLGTRISRRLWRHSSDENVGQRLRENSTLQLIRHRFAKRIAAVKTATALAWLAGFDQVVTDRLHGVLLSKKLGLPVSVIDNDHGKIFRYIETWSSQLPTNIRMYQSLSEAADSANA